MLERRTNPRPDIEDEPLRELEQLAYVLVKGRDSSRANSMVHYTNLASN